jgi:hypothetical protein
MTEVQIERSVERQIDSLDKRYLSTGMTEAEYTQAMRGIDAWARAHYHAREAPR